jgi:DNA repair protein RadA/Sms
MTLNERRSPRSSRKGGRVQFVCSECGDSFAQWFGRCPSCQAWGSLKEFRTPAESPEPTGFQPGRGHMTSGILAAPTSQVQRLRDIPLDSVPRLASGIGEFDRALGGGLVAGSAVLIGGDPGIGKSTLLLQVAGALVGEGVNVLYVSGEESAAQVRLRCERIAGVSRDLLLLAESNLEAVAPVLERVRPQVLIIDSIQTAYLPSLASAPGSLLQVRESALSLVNYARAQGACVLLVGHVTKEGMLAGPKTLEHMVDTVLYLEGERYHHYRVLRSAKNRFGSVHEIGVFEMADDGLREVPNPSQVFLSAHTAGAVGSVVVASLEGSRALLIEVQALVHASRYNVPQRVSTGYDGRRLEILLAVLGKRGKMETTKFDVFVKVAGGLKVEEPGVDLGVLLAVASSLAERPPHPDLVVLGEVGLGGEVRRIVRAEQRLSEAARLGYGRVVLPGSNLRDLASRPEGMRLIGVSAVIEALDEALQPRTEPLREEGSEEE